MFGILLVDKPLGCSSHDVVDQVRRKLGTRRVGHAGTLDPQATGLLVVAVGPATRFLQFLPLEPKQYIGRFRFGAETETFDSEGRVVSKHEVPPDLRGEIESHLPSFKGLISQLPPMYSAVKVDGKPLYSYARQGQELQREPRTVHIDTLEILDGESPEFTFKIVCSGGTYVRSLANDLGHAIGCGAYLAGLKRVGVGRFTIGEATLIEEIDESKLIPLSQALPPMPLIEANVKQVEHVREGRPIGLADPPGSALAALIEPGGDVFAVARVHGNVLQPECVIPAGIAHGVS